MVLEVFHNEGDEVPVLMNMMVIGQAGETGDWNTAGEPSPSASAPEAVAPQSISAATVSAAVIQEESVVREAHTASATGAISPREIGRAHV